MNRQYFLISALLIVLFAGAVSADFSVPSDVSCPEQTLQNCEAIADIGVEVGAGVPPIVPSDSIINMYLMDDTVIGHVVVADGNIQETVCCTEHENQTHVAKVVNTGVLEEIRAAEDQLSEADRRLKNDDISFKAESVGAKARLAVAKAFLRIRTWFS